MSVQHVRFFGDSGSLHMTLEPLDEENEGVFQMTLTRPEAKNAIGKSSCPCRAGDASCMTAVYVHIPEQ